MSSAFGWWRTTLFFFLGKKALFLWEENIAFFYLKHCMGETNVFLRSLNVVRLIVQLGTDLPDIIK